MEPEGLTPFLDELASLAATRGFDGGFAARACDAARATADPRAALSRLVNLFALVEEPGFYSLLADPDGLASLLAVLGYSGFLSSLIQRCPGDYVWLFRQAGLFTTRTASVMESDLAARLDQGMEAEEAARELRAAKYREMLRIGVKDLLGAAPLAETVRELSALAEASIDAAAAAAFAILRRRHGVPLERTGHGMTRPARFCVLGLGKLGGEELNYSSDVDLLYLYSHHQGRTTGRPSPLGGFTDALENHAFFVRMGELVTRLVGERTNDGIVFRVDLRLRPEGESGELAYSLHSLETYYQSWGRLTDRLALLKARPVGGDRRLGEDLLRRVVPFVWPRHLDYSALEEIGELKRRIDLHEGDAPGPGGLPRDIKLGRGGIREVEFVVQSLQLVHGGRTPALRERGTLRAISRLAENGYLSERDAALLSDSYAVLRAAEHRVQLVEERQTHELPRDPEALARLAHTMGFRAPAGRGGDAEALVASLGRITSDVHALFSRTFSFGAPDPAGGAPVAGAALPPLLREGLERGEGERGLAALGLADPPSAWGSLQLLRDGPATAYLPDGCRRMLRAIAPLLLAELAGSPDPDAVLAYFARFVGRVGARAGYYELLARNPRAVHLLATLFGSSPFLSGVLVRSPDLLDLLVGGEGLGTSRGEGGLAQEARDALRGSPSFEDALNALRRLRNAEFLRVGLGELVGLRDGASVQAELSHLADAMVGEALALACRETGRGAGGLDDFAVAAFGKLGGREMSYGSDLDLVFLHRGEDAEGATYLAQKAITVMTSPTGEGVLYAIDMRLRPSGHQGPLVASRESFLRYHREERAPWEHQALVKARVVAGGEGFSRDLAADLADLAYGRALTLGELAEIVRVRGRMEEELAGESDGRWWDIKNGRGGLADVEFCAQLLQLLHGPAQPALRTPSTPEALSALARGGHLSQSGYNTLSRAYWFYRGIEGRARLQGDRPDPRVPRDPDKLAPLARALGRRGGREAGEELLREMGNIREETRSAWEEAAAGAAAFLRGGK
jgi:glutamate-ammonia-ligase adenylyltransferase